MRDRRHTTPAPAHESDTAQGLTRACPKCGHAWPLDRDHFRASATDAAGYERVCKICRRAQGRALDPIRDVLRRDSLARGFHNRAARANHRARRLGVAGILRAVDISDKWTRQRQRCADCGVMLDRHYHVDHRTPLERGGTNTPDNIALVCRRCNAHKASMSYSAWVAQCAARGIDHTDRAALGHALQIPLFNNEHQQGAQGDNV